MVQFALLAVLGLSQSAPHDSNVWYCPYIEVTGHSPFDHTPGGAYDPRDLFGGTYGTVPGEYGKVVFEDDLGGPSYHDFVEWTTKTPVEINRLVFSWQDDSPGNNWRNLAHFWILGKDSPSANWKILWQEDTPQNVGLYTMSHNIATERCQFFRAEFIRSSAADVSAVAPRICEIEAYGHAVSE